MSEALPWGIKRGPRKVTRVLGWIVGTWLKMRPRDSHLPVWLRGPASEFPGLVLSPTFSGGYTGRLPSLPALPGPSSAAPGAPMPETPSGSSASAAGAAPTGTHGSGHECRCRCLLIRGEQGHLPMCCCTAAENDRMKAAGYDDLLPVEPDPRFRFEPTPLAMAAGDVVTISGLEALGAGISRRTLEACGFHPFYTYDAWWRPV